MATREQNEDRYFDLCEQAMDDMKITPEEFGDIFYYATEPRRQFEDRSDKIKRLEAKRTIRKLPYGEELLRLDKNVMSYYK